MTTTLKVTGHCTYNDGHKPYFSDNGKTSFDMTIKEDGTVYGSGRDNVGQFTISNGTLKGIKLVFHKYYTGQDIHWKYSGNRLYPDGPDDDNYHFNGQWYPPSTPHSAGGNFDFKAVPE